MANPLAGLPPRLLRTKEAARFLGISIRTLEKHRTYGTGPTYRKACFDVIAIATELGTLRFEVDRFLTGFVSDGPADKDEIGTYVGEYTAARSETDDVLVRRRKSSYRVDEDARQLGMRVQVLGAETDARFDTGRPAWMRRVEGRELVRFVLPGREAQAFVHRFEAQRDDTAIAALDTTPDRSEP